MTPLLSLVRRNCKIFFRDKGVFLPSLLAPLILLFLFVAFLGNVYRDSVRDVLFGFALSDGAVESIASGWLVSSLLSVCTVTVAFTANTIMVQDRATGQADDLFVTPAPRSTIALGYFLSTYLVTFAVCLAALGAGLIYIAAAGWRLSAGDVFLTLADVALLAFFGTALSAAVCGFLRSQGGVVAIQAIVSSAYGFLCGAYMPIASLTDWLRNAVSLLPGTYGTGLLRAHLMNGAIEALAEEGIPAQLAEGLKEGFDCKLFFFGSAVPQGVCYAVVAAAVLLFVGVYVLRCLASRRK